VLGASQIFMELGSTIFSNYPAQIDYPPIHLQGDAAVEARSTGSHWKTTAFQSITGAHILTIVGNNGHWYMFTAANTFSSLLLNAVGRYRVRATAQNSLGSGDVIVSARAGDSRSAQLFLDVAGTISDSATLTHNGNGWDESTTDRITIASGATEAVGALIIDGEYQPAGIYNKDNADWLSGDGVLIVRADSGGSSHTRCACENPGHGTYPSCALSTTCSCNGKVRLGLGSSWFRYTIMEARCDMDFWVWQRWRTSNEQITTNSEQITNK
jgi:hypothetical protein